MGTRIGYVAGAFDTFDVVHLNTLRHARTHCDVLIAGVVSDDTVRLVTGSEPVASLADRAQILRSIGFVDDVHLPTTDDVMDAWRALKFTRYLKNDWCGPDESPVLERKLADVGADVVYLPHTARRLSTSLWRAVDTIAGNSPAVVG